MRGNDMTRQPPMMATTAPLVQEKQGRPVFHPLARQLTISSSLFPNTSNLSSSTKSCDTQILTLSMLCRVVRP